MDDDNKKKKRQHPKSFDSNVSHDAKKKQKIEHSDKSNKASKEDKKQVKIKHEHSNNNLSGTNAGKEQKLSKPSKVKEAEPAEEMSKGERKKARITESRVWRKFDRKENPESANMNYTRYYKDICKIADSEKDFAEFVDFMQRPLPVCIRVPNSSNALRKNNTLSSGNLEDYYHDSIIGRANLLCLRRAQQSFIRGDKFLLSATTKEVMSHQDILKPLPVIADGLIWKVGAENAALSKSGSLKNLDSFIQREAQVNHLGRQGLESMYPAIMLSPEKNANILDVCASPGSKTTQLLEMSYCEPISAAGIAIANELDPRRAGRLRERIYMGTICGPQFVVVCDRGELLSQKIRESVGSKLNSVLVDVPCTGDGTFRKAPYLWKRWKEENAVMIQPIQVQLALSGASLLEIGGKLVYSTCSLNPVENEEAVIKILEQSKGSLKLIDIPPVPGIVYRKGLPKYGDSVSNYCARIMPNDQDTGGFFFALFERVQPPSADKNQFISDVEMVDENESLKVMDSLGYMHNPTNEAESTLQGNEESSSSQIGALQYTIADDQISNSFLNHFGIQLPSNLKLARHQTRSKYVVSNIDDYLFEKEEESDIVVLSLVTKEVASAITSWIGKTKCFHAGVQIAYAKFDQFTEKLGHWQLIPSGVPALISLIRNTKLLFLLDEPRDLLHMYNVVAGSIKEPIEGAASHALVRTEEMLDRINSETLKEALKNTKNRQTIIISLSESAIAASVKSLDKHLASVSKGGAIESEQPKTKLSIAERKKLKKMKQQHGQVKKEQGSNDINVSKSAESNPTSSSTSSSTNLVYKTSINLVLTRINQSIFCANIAQQRLESFTNVLEQYIS